MIQINDKLRIKKLDNFNLIAIEELQITESKKLGEHKEWCLSGYYGNLKDAIIGVLNKQLFNLADKDEEVELKQIIYKLESFENQIKNAINI